LGSGKNGDQGTGILVLVRIDRGTANIVEDLNSLVVKAIESVNGAGFKASSLAVGDLYRGTVIWATRLGQQPTSSLRDELQLASSLAGAAPQTCSTGGLDGLGRSLGNVQAAGVVPYYPPPAAFLTILVDTGPRPAPVESCPNASSFGVDPAAWAQFGFGPLPRYATRFAFISTSETETADQMRTRCLATAGFPTSALDSLAPSPLSFFGPLSADLNGMLGNLSVGIDGCAALSPSDASLSAFVKQWYTDLANR
jgi:hypothetical protein